MTIQKHCHLAHLNTAFFQINEYRSQVADMRRSSEALNASSLEQHRVDKDQLIRSLKNERKKHLEEVLQLKYINRWHLANFDRANSDARAL